MPIRIAPGTRIRCRNEDWLVRKVDQTSHGETRLTAVGLTPLVQDYEATFLQSIDRDITIVDPAETRPVADRSGHFLHARLHLEFLLRNTAPTGPALTFGHRGAMDKVGYQLQPAHQALQQHRQRILIADAVGLGKTLECGVLLSELIRRGKARRILVLTVKSMMTQFQKELWSRFTIPLVRLDSQKIASIRRDTPATSNPFHHHDRTIVSIDTIKQDGQFRDYLENAWWDVIVVDEAHNIARRGGSGSSQRHRVAERLAGRSDSLILLSATPHDGSKSSFASIMSMLDPTAIKDPENYGPDDIRGLFIRRFKKDVISQLREAFPERITHTLHRDASPQEENAYQALANLTFTKIDSRRQSGALLFKTLLEKSLFSSPAACLETIQNRLKNLRKKDDLAFEKDIAGLEFLADAVGEIQPRSFARYQLLLNLLSPASETSIAWEKSDSSDRLVIFTERIATMDWLAHNLRRDLKLKKAEVVTLHGGLSDHDQNAIVEDFGRARSPLRVLVCSDVASEGINLHYQSHRLFHFDIPWSLLTFQQRNGRVDRYGQTSRPEIYYLLTRSAHDGIGGDLRIQEILIRKDQQVVENIGDPSEFTGLHTAAEEEEKVGLAIEKKQSPEEFDATYGTDQKATQDDPLLALLLGGNATPPTPESPSLTTDQISIFPNDYHFAKSAFQFVRTQGDSHWHFDPDDASSSISLHLPEDFKRRLKSLPPEIKPGDAGWTLTTDRSAVMQEIARCRAQEDAWPGVHLLWDLHPLMRWLQDKVLTAFGRAEAPVIQLPHLPPGEVIILGYGLIPNRKGHPLVQSWAGIHFKDDTYHATLTLEDTLTLTQIRGQDFPNRTTENPDFSHLQPLIASAVGKIQTLLRTERQTFDDHITPDLIEQLDRLEEFGKSRLSQLELELSDNAQRHQSEIRSVTDLVKTYGDWIKDTLETEDNPSIIITTLFIPEPSS